MAGAARVLIVVLPLWVVLVVPFTPVDPFGAFDFSGENLLLALGALITVPLQAAGEEYLFRGILSRAIGGRFRRPALAFGVSPLITTVVFAGFRGAGDVWGMA